MKDVLVSHGDAFAFCLMLSLLALHARGCWDSTQPRIAYEGCIKSCKEVRVDASHHIECVRACNEPYTIHAQPPSTKNVQPHKE